MAKVSLQGVSKFYGKVQAVKKIDLETNYFEKKNDDKVIINTSIKIHK